MWCGDLMWSKKRCGDGPKSTYYTQSANIKAYGEITTTLKPCGSSTYSYVACEDGIGFGSKGIEYPLHDGGIFRCTRTGSGH